jgi:CelD/BcsL family acetyltransferase involved in cellulose biosynthesis
VAADRGWLSLSFLDLDHQPVAGIYGFVYGETYYFYLPGFAPDVASHTSPGMLLLAHRLERALAEGQQQVDLLQGDAGYKLTWANDRRRTLTLRAYNRRLAALCQRLTEYAKEWVKIALR